MLTYHQLGLVAFIWCQFHEIPQPPFTKVSLKITYLKLNWNLPGTNELIISQYWYGTGSSNLSSWRTVICSSHINNNVAAAVSLTEGARASAAKSGLDIKHLVNMPIMHMVLKIYMPCKNFDVPSQYLYKPCKAYVCCWRNKYMPRLKNHLPSWARNHKSLCALGQDLHAPGMRARLNVEPCKLLVKFAGRFQFQHQGAVSI